MFTGIVQAVGRVDSVEHIAGGRAMWVVSDVLATTVLGASVALSGVCLTVVDGLDERRRFDVSPETLARTSLGQKRPGSRLNVERPLRAGDELGGHIVQGHVDGVGGVMALERSDDVRLRVAAEAPLLRFVVEKGSITVDGVSLTVSGLDLEWFEVALIPHTLGVTTLGELAVGDPVNLEVDVMAKHIERLLAPWSDRVSAGPPRPDDPYH